MELVAQQLVQDILPMKIMQMALKKAKLTLQWYKTMKKVAKNLKEIILSSNHLINLSKHHKI